MYIKTLLAKANENDAAGVYPSSLKHFWKCTEASGAKTLVDAIGGANITWTGAPTSTMASGQVTLSGTLSGQALAANMTAIGTSDFLLVIGGNDSSAFSNMKIGNAGATEYVDMINTGGNSTVVGGSGTTTITSAGFTASGNGSHSLARSSSPDETGIYINGVVDAAAVADAAGSIAAFTQIVAWHQALKLSGMALFIFDDGLPADFKQAASWMGNQWVANNKLVWPKWA